MTFKTQQINETLSVRNHQIRVRCGWNTHSSTFVFHILIITWLSSGLMPSRGKGKAGQWDMAAVVLLVSKTGKCFNKLEELHRKEKNVDAAIKVLKCCSWDMLLHLCLYLCIWNIQCTVGSLIFQKWSTIMSFPLSWQIYLAVCTVSRFKSIWTFGALHNALNSYWTDLECITHLRLLATFSPRSVSKLIAPSHRFLQITVKRD